ncbi:MAG: sugar kinase [Chitinophagaceae bacterium]|nr:sugar kinase [Chitinophagaceae bacterium]
MNSPVSVITFGEIMLRLEAQSGQRLAHGESFRRFYGGSEANVAVLLAQLGIPVSFVTAVPDNTIGQGAIDAVRSFAVNTNSILRSGKRLGIYYTENGNSIRPSRVVYDREHSSFAELQTGKINWQELFNGHQRFHWSGITPAINSNCASLILEGLKVAKDAGLSISADMNYRSTLWNYGSPSSAIMPELLNYCDTIVGDIDTAEQYFGIKISSSLSVEDKFAQCADQLQLTLPSLKLLAMSFRGFDANGSSTYQGAIRMAGKDSFTRIYKLPVTIDRIGSGDAFTAGLLYGLCNQLNAEQIIHVALACGAIKHSMEGDFCVTSLEEIKTFIHSGPSNRVSR